MKTSVATTIETATNSFLADFENMGTSSFSADYSLIGTANRDIEKADNIYA